MLLADDSLTIRKVVSLTFNDEAMEVSTVGSGAEALESLDVSLPDIVLADVFMPEPNGYQLCERIKSGERTRHIPVVLLVGTFEPFNEAEARRVGADEVLTKPFQSIRDLVNKVGGLLGGADEKSSHPAPARDEQSTEETTQDLSPFSTDARAAAPTADAATPAADAFKDFDMDDATIQSTPAAAFDARPVPAPEVLEINEEEHFSDRGETEEAFVLGEDEPQLQSPVAAAPTTGEISYAPSPAASTEAAPVVSASVFSTHAARAAEADDALLELGDIAPAHGSAAVEADDFILDIGDEGSPGPIAAAPPEYPAPGEYAAPTEYAAPAEQAASVAEIDMLFAENAPLTEAPEAFAEPEKFAEPKAFTEQESFTRQESFTEQQAFIEPEVSARSQASDELDLWPSPTAAVAETEPTLLSIETGELEAPEISEAPSLLFANESAADARGSESFAEQESMQFAQDAPVWDGEPVAASIVAHAGNVVAPVEITGESQPAEAFAVDASSTAMATSASSTAASSESNQAASPAPALSPEMLDEIVRRVVAQMSEKVVREIAWEVVPDLAERLIKQRLEEERTRTTH